MAGEEYNKLAPYPQMILTAIEALNEKDGSSEASISKYMESNHPELPASHAALLSQHLTRLRETGDVIFSHNTYKKPDQHIADAAAGAPPQKRGRGRPPKPKSAEAADTIVSATPRPRGRPPRDPSAAPEPKKAKTAVAADGDGSGSVQPRGRPRKYPGLSGGGAVPVSAPVPSGRPRGRPPKAKPNMTEEKDE